MNVYYWPPYIYCGECHNAIPQDIYHPLVHDGDWYVRGKFVVLYCANSRCPNFEKKFRLKPTRIELEPV